MRAESCVSHDLSLSDTAVFLMHTSGSTIMTFKAELQALKTSLIQQRDELTLQLGLAKLEARDEWHEVETKASHFMSKIDALGDEVAEDISTATKQLGDDIKQAYEKLKTTLS